MCICVYMYIHIYIYIYIYIYVYIYIERERERESLCRPSEATLPLALGGGRRVSRFGGASLCMIQCQSASLCISTWDFCCVRIVFDSPCFASVSESFARPNAVTARYSSWWCRVPWSFVSSSQSIRFAFSWYISTRSALSAFIRRLLLSSSTRGPISSGLI